MGDSKLSSSRPHVGIAAEGEVLVAWTRPTRRRGPLRYSVETATRESPGRPWRPVGPLGPAISRSSPRLALTLAGRATLVWVEGRLVGRSRSPGGAWSRATILSARPAVVDEPAVAVDAAGRDIAAWTSRGLDAPTLPPRGGAVLVAERAPGGEWEGPRSLVPGDAGGVDLAAGARDGGALVAWLAETPAGARVTVADRAPAGEWGAPVPLSGPGARSVRVALGPRGDAHVAWYQDGAVWAARRAPGEAWGAPAPVSADPPVPESVFEPPALVVDDSGAAVLAWRAATGGRVVLRAAVSAAGGPWSPAESLSSPAERSAGPPALARSGRRAIVAWSQGGVVRARVRSLPAGAWSSPERVSDAAGEGIRPAIAMGTGGQVVCAYLLIARDAAGSRRGITVRVAERGPLPPAAPPRSVRLTAAQLAVNQRIAQAALRRVNAVLQRLDAGITGADIRDGTLGPGSFGPGVVIGGREEDAVVPPGPPVPVRAAGPRRRAQVRLSAAQLAVNQRIAQAAIRRAELARRRLDAGLTGADVRDGSITGADLAPGLSVVAADLVPAPTPPRAAASPPGPRRAGAARLSVPQLVVDQRIAREAVRRANALVFQVEGGFSGADLRPGSLGAADLAPSLRP